MVPLIAAIAIGQSVQPAGQGVGGWKCIHYSTFRSDARYEFSKGPLTASVRIHTHATVESAKGFDGSVLTYTNAAQFPLKNEPIEKAGLRLFDTHSGRVGEDGKIVLDPMRGFMIHGAVGKHSYMIGVRMSEVYPRDMAIKNLERFVPALLKNAKPSEEADPTVFKPMKGPLDRSGNNVPPSP